MATIQPSLPKGTRDFLPNQMLKRQFVIDIIRDVFERYGYEPLETPSIEKLKVLSGKYGDEGEQLMFKVLRRGTKLEDLRRGQKEFLVTEYGQLVDEALRYDLTVPLSRVIAMHQAELTFPFKRYQIQPVWRADRPQRGRYREFYQCDIDAVGTDSLLADAEAIAVINEIWEALRIPNFTIRINNRKLLSGILQAAKISPALSTPVFVAIDKLDKIGLDGVRKELEYAELAEKDIDALLSIFGGQYANNNLLQGLLNEYADVELIHAGANELLEMMTFLENMGVPKSAYKVDLFLVRGLGYYTGPIYESVVEEPKIGSLGGGGRYDRLIGMFLGQEVPATGTSFGIDRIIDVMEELSLFPDVQTKTSVLVCMFDENTRLAAIRFTQRLRDSGVKAENYLAVSKLKKQFSYAHKRGIPHVAVIGPDEMAKNKVTLKNMVDGNQKIVLQDEAIEILRRV